VNVEEHLLVEIDRANTLEQVCLAEACDADLPVEKRERAERNHKLAGATSHELRTMLARHVLLS
jgi:hypothetical protein